MKTYIRNWFALVLIAAASSAPITVRGQENPPDIAHTNIIEVVEPLATNSAESPAEEADPGGVRMAAVVTFGRTAELMPGNSAEAVVAIGGSARVQGNVRDAVVAILGDAEVNGEVRDAVVAVLGNVRLGSNAIVHGDVVAVGGKVEFADGAVVRGHVQPLEFGIPGIGSFDGLGLWVKECVILMRPLSLQIRWVWIVTGVFVLMYFLMALAFPKPVRVCLDEMTNRPATTFFVGLLTKIMIPLIILVLAATGIGLLVVPFFLAAMFFGLIVGKAAVLQYLGGALGRPLGLDAKTQPLIAFLVGTGLMIGLYLVPVLGFVTFTVLGLWGLGAAVTGVFARMSREKQRPVPPTSGGNTTGSEVPPLTSAANPDLAGAAPSVAVGFSASPAAPTPVLVAYPKAGFWERMGAAFLDLALLLVPLVILGPLGIVVALAYFAGMWAWKGTTIGGLVLNHRIVRQDGSPLTFVVALVRGLAAAFSGFVLFLGFFWIGWDPEKQGWHDKIAGTYVVRTPRAMPLLCL